MTWRLTSALLCGAALLAPPAARAQTTDPVDSIIVTGERREGDPPPVAEARERLSRTPGGVAVISNESYETRSARGVVELLRDAPGVLAEPRYGEESRLSIRGSGLGQAYHQRGVLIAQDGVPFADADGFSDFQKVDPLTARYVEVYRGGNALRLGAAQLGGAINLVTPTGRTAESPNLLRIEGGSFDTQRAAAQIARVHGPWDAYAALTGLSTDGPREHSAQEQVRGTLNLGRQLGEDREVRLILYGADIAQEVPGSVDLATALADPGAAGANVVARDFARDQSIWRSSLQTGWRLTDSTRFEGAIYATGMDLHHPISLEIDQQSATQGAFGRLEWEGDALGRRADFYWGASYRQGTNDQTLFPVLFPTAGNALQKATESALFAEGRFFLTDHFALVGGGSLGWATRDYKDRLDPANDASADFDWTAPRVGALWESDEGIQVYANVTKSAEPPHYGALVQAPYPGFVPVRPQLAWTAEIGTRGQLGALLWDVTLYRAKLEGELLSFADTYGLPSAVANADDTLHQGAEVALDWAITDRFLGGALGFKVTYTYSDFRFDDDPVYGDNTLPVAPPQAGVATLRYRRPGGWFLAPSVEWRPDGVYVDYANTLEAPGYTVWSLDAGYEAKSGLTLFVDVRNLADEAYVPEVGAVTDASSPGVSTAVFYPGERRAAYAGLSWRF